MQRADVLTILPPVTAHTVGSRGAAGYRAALLCIVQVFGCRHDDAIHALRRPASEKRQGTKSREVGHRRCRGRYGELAAVRDLSAE